MCARVWFDCAYDVCYVCRVVINVCDFISDSSEANF